MTCQYFQLTSLVRNTILTRLPKVSYKKIKSNEFSQLLTELLGENS